MSETHCGHMNVLHSTFFYFLSSALICIYTTNICYLSLSTVLCLNIQESKQLTENIIKKYDYDPGITIKFSSTSARNNIKILHSECFYFW